ncbi:hypothetical protein U9M48_021640 [Paspalum notatum var. saurae]|uniref:Uncharacterized protein n=1 Tax=Paspalum notatum var. saurae TaxID=547442 RepID=A0AAQ3TG18_PASNO
MADDGVGPEVTFSDGDSVRLTVAVGRDNFQDLAGDHARDTMRLTFSPFRSPCSHVPATVLDLDAPPLFDRGVVRDDAGLREAFLRDHRALALAGDRFLDEWDLSRRPGVVLATFRFTEKHVRALGRHVESETSARCSPYALACGAAWAGVVHARGNRSGSARFGFVTGCKPRAKPLIPANYFGNCLGQCRVEAKANGLTAAAASAAIWRVIEGLAEEGRVSSFGFMS